MMPTQATLDLWQNEWVPALRGEKKGRRGGTYRQTQSTLHDTKGYCCLGVLCDVGLPSTWRLLDPSSEYLLYVDGKAYGSSVVPTDFSERLLGINDGASLPLPPGKKAGDYLPEKFRSTSSIALTAMNDSGSSFEEIADVIDRVANDWRSYYETIPEVDRP